MNGVALIPDLRVYTSVALCPGATDKYDLAEWTVQHGGELIGLTEETSDEMASLLFATPNMVNLDSVVVRYGFSSQLRTFLAANKIYLAAVKGTKLKSSKTQAQAVTSA
eukprot:4041595-Amphidinium_carterae.1